MWIKTHIGRLINTDQCEMIRIERLSGTYVITACMYNEDEVIWRMDFENGNEFIDSKESEETAHKKAQDIVEQILLALDRGDRTMDFS